MTSQCRAVLRQLRILSANTEVEMLFIHRNTHIARMGEPAKKYNYIKYRDEINGIIQSLEKDGYLAYDDDPSDAHTAEHTKFHLTHRGLHPYQATYEQIRNFLLKSVLVPVAVSIVTTLIALWLQA